MIQPWFAKWGWLFRPLSYEGWIVVLFLLLFSIHTAVFVDAQSHSVSDTLYGLFPYLVPAFGIYLWIGKKTCEKEGAN